MAIIDKFLSVQTEGAGGTLIVRGETVDEKDERVDLGHDAQILVAVIHVGHLTNRADLKVEEPVNNPWVAKTGSHLSMRTTKSTPWGLRRRRRPTGRASSPTGLPSASSDRTSHARTERRCLGKRGFVDQCVRLEIESLHARRERDVGRHLHDQIGFVETLRR